MKIPRFVRRRPAFRRRTSPPPAARKLLLASLASGVVLLAMLAVVFIPIALHNESRPPIPRIEFALNTTTGSPVVVVVAVTLLRPLADYRAEYWRGSGMIATINLSAGPGNATLSFSDRDGDQALSVGDEFRVEYNGTETLRVFYTPENAIIGYWPTPP